MKLLVLLATMSIMMKFTMASQLTKNSTATLHITEPRESSVLYNNKTLNITWTSAASDRRLIQIKLMHGSLKALETVKVLATNVHSNLAHFIITLPTDIPVKNNYTLALGPDSQSTAYVGNLTIVANPLTSQHSSNDTTYAVTSVPINPATDDNPPMRDHNGRKIISSAIHAHKLPITLLKLFTVVVFMIMFTI